jgi:RHS repeat-associated protein
LLYQTVDDVIYIPCYDNNGNITKYIDANGNIVASYTYNAFGCLISKSGVLADFFRHRFSTKYFDAETCLYYNGYRFYHPILMRWLNLDPIGEDGGVNLYEFCGNNPVCRYDMDGRAYFAYRPLDFELGRWVGIWRSRNKTADKENHIFAHEQLIFEDGGSPINIGYFEAPIGVNNPRQDEFHFQTQYVPIQMRPVPLFPIPYTRTRFLL